MRKICKIMTLTSLAILLPKLSRAQGLGDDLHSLQGVLNQLYDQMLPLCSGMIGVSRAIAGFGALWYIAARVWKHLAAAEPVDVFPLLRPFALGFCILIFPSVLALMNGVLQPVVTATQSMVSRSNQAIARLLQDQQNAGGQEQGASLNGGDPDKWYQYSHPAGAEPGGTVNIADQFSGWGWKNMIKKAIAELLNILFEAAALCIDTIRTFKLVVLSILGPLCFGLSIFDGFQHSLKQWIARYVNVFMWLPVANIFGAIIARIQENMILAQQTGNLAGNEFGNTNTAYLIFLVIGIVGYFTVPSIANYIMNVGGHALFSRTSALASMAISYATNYAVRSFGGNNSQQTNSKTVVNPSDASIQQSKNAHARDKLSGKN